MVATILELSYVVVVQTVSPCPFAARLGFKTLTVLPFASFEILSATTLQPPSSMATPVREDQKDRKSTESQEADPQGGIQVPNLSSKEPQDQTAPTNGNDPPNSDAEKDEDVEASAEQPSQHDDVLAKEDYSVFTVPQKRAIVLAGSFIGWFSPVRHQHHMTLSRSKS